MTTSQQVALGTAFISAAMAIGLILTITLANLRVGADAVALERPIGLFGFVLSPLSAAVAAVTSAVAKR